MGGIYNVYKLRVEQLDIEDGIAKPSNNEYVLFVQAGSMEDGKAYYVIVSGNRADYKECAAKLLAATFDDKVGSVDELSYPGIFLEHVHSVTDKLSPPEDGCTKWTERVIKSLRGGKVLT